MSKPKKLKVGDIWGVLPLEKTLEVRTIHFFLETKPVTLEYYDIAGTCWEVSIEDFRFWITCKKAKRIGHYDFNTGNTVAKGGKR